MFWQATKKAVIYLYFIGMFFLVSYSVGEVFDVQYGLDKTRAELDQAGMFLLVYAIVGAIVWFTWNAVFPKNQTNNHN